MKSRRRSQILVLAAVCLVAAIVVAVLVTHDGTSASNDLASSQATHHHSHRAPGVKVCDTGSRTHTLPAALLGRTASNVPTQILIPVNAWSAADCHTETWLYAGAAGWQAGSGIFVIMRTKGDYHEQPPHYLVVPGSGATRITQAPLGPQVVTSAQRHGQFKFTSRRGMAGTIDLASDTATLTTGEVIHATTKPYSQSN